MSFTCLPPRSYQWRHTGEMKQPVTEQERAVARSKRRLDQIFFPTWIGLLQVLN